MRNLLCLTLFAGAVAMGISSSRGHAFQADDVIALERAALDRWGKGDPQGFIELYAPEVTYFDPFQAKRIDGLEAMKKMLEPITGKVSVSRYDMIGPRVQRHGDVVVLTYNIVSYNKKPDGAESVAARWNSTAVFRRIDGRWRTIHSHWSFTQPELKAPPGEIER